MSTYFANANTIERKWYVIDAANKPLGRTAVAAANILRGKHRPEFTPHADCGEFVIIINADKAVLTGRKLEQKYYYHHSGYIGGMKAVQYKTLMATKPELAMEMAVKAEPGNRHTAHLHSKNVDHMTQYAKAIETVLQEIEHLQKKQKELILLMQELKKQKVIFI